jgi:ankyrin repeat protein
MKSQLIAIVAAVLVVGCGQSQPTEPPKAKAPDISIHEAAGTGNIEVVKQHLAAGTDVNAKDGGGTPLWYAADHGHKEVAELLIAKGADVNARDDVGRTPLHIAAIYGYKEIAELLIAKGADVNAKIEGGGTPLHIAAHLGHKEVAELLIAKGADVNAKIEGGNAKWETPLDLAEEVDEDDSPEDKAVKKEIANLLRKHGGKTGAELKAEGK